MSKKYKHDSCYASRLLQGRLDWHLFEISGLDPGLLKCAYLVKKIVPR